MTDRSSAKSDRENVLLRHAADVLVELSQDGRILYMSDAVEPIVARSADWFVGRSFIEIIAPEDRAENLAIFQKVVTTGAANIARFRIPRKDGFRITFESTIRTFEDKSGSLRVVACARDVTQQTAESAVASQREAYYRAISESDLRLVAIFSWEGEILFSNHRFAATFGRVENVLDVFNRISDESREVVETAWFESRRPDGDGRATADFEYPNEDGTSSWFAATWEAFDAENGERYFTVLYDDISQRKQIEHALQAIAEGIAVEGAANVHANVERVARILDLDRLALGRLHPDRPAVIDVVHAWRDGVFFDIEEIDLTGLPDEAVTAGETCLYRSDIARLNPRVSELLGPDMESYIGVPLRSADGRVIGMLGGYSRKPITNPQLTRSLFSTVATQAAADLDRERANEEIRANQDRFDVVARQASELLVELDAEGVITYISQAIFALLGYQPNDLVGQKFVKLTHPDDRLIVDRSNQDLLDGADQTLVTLRALHADGTWRWCEARTSPFTASDGSKRALILARDITDQRMEAVTRDLAYRVIQQGVDLFFVCDPDATVVFANESARRRLTTGHANPPGSAPDSSPSSQIPPTASEGKTEEAVHERLLRNAPVQDGPLRDEDDPAASASPLAGRSFYDFLPEQEVARFRDQIIPQLTQQSVWNGEVELRSDIDGHRIPTEARAFLIAAGEGKEPNYLAITLRDIEARRSAEEALHQSELLLTQAQKMEAVGRLAGGVAHDFNNLLTAIIGYSDLVLDEVGQEHVVRRDVEEILRAAERAGGLTRQLLAFSRRQVLQPEPVDLNVVVANVDRMLRRLIGENIELVTAQDGELRSIIADPGQIEQVIVNLVVNARDAMPQGGRLEIETANWHTKTEMQTASGLLPAGEYVLLRISDTGIGMDEQTRAMIFEPFFTTKEAHQGTGLGLASVYGIVSQSGGQIDVESDPGSGARFTVYLPAARAVTAKADTAEKSFSLKGSETVLLVEDAAPVRRLVQRTLEKSGYKVLSAESATAALRHCSRHQGPIDLIVTDVVLPRTAGPEIARRAQELRPGIRVLFISGFTDETLSRHGLDPTRAELLEKPFTPVALLTRVRTLLDEAVDPPPADSGEKSDSRPPSPSGSAFLQ